MKSAQNDVVRVDSLIGHQWRRVSGLISRWRFNDTRCGFGGFPLSLEVAHIRPRAALKYAVESCFKSATARAFGTKGGARATHLRSSRPVRSRIAPDKCHRHSRLSHRITDAEGRKSRSPHWRARVLPRLHKWRHEKCYGLDEQPTAVAPQHKMRPRSPSPVIMRGVGRVLTK